MLPAGTYWIGDLCYVLSHKWDKICDVVVDGTGCSIEGIFSLEDNTRFAFFNAYDEEGEFECSASDEPLGCDSGSIGCVSVEHIDTLSEEASFGVIVEMKKPFDPYVDEEGRMFFGRVVVFTKGDEE